MPPQKVFQSMDTLLSLCGGADPSDIWDFDMYDMYMRPRRHYPMRAAGGPTTYRRHDGRGELGRHTARALDSYEKMLKVSVRKARVREVVRGIREFQRKQQEMKPTCRGGEFVESVALFVVYEKEYQEVQMEASEGSGGGIFFFTAFVVTWSCHCFYQRHMVFMILFFRFGLVCDEHKRKEQA